MIKSLTALLALTSEALASPAELTGRDLDEAKKIGYFWAAPGNASLNGYFAPVRSLAVYSLDDDTFGQQIALVDVPKSGNNPRYISASADGKTLFAGGLLSFNTTEPYNSNYLRSVDFPLSSATEEIRLIPNGGFMISNVGSGDGSSPGRLVETDSNYNIIDEYPSDLNSLTHTGDASDRTTSQFSPHGLYLNTEKNIMLSSDFFVPNSLLKPSTEVQHANTLRLWNMTSMEILSTITIANASGVNDVKFIPDNKEHAAIATAVGLGQAWIIYPFRKNVNGHAGTAELLFDFKVKSKEAAIYLDITQDGKYAYFSLPLNSHIVQLDISDLSAPKRLDDPSSVLPYIGTRYAKIAPDQRHVVIIDYFVQTGDAGIVNTPADYKVLYTDINDDGSLAVNRTIDFAAEFAESKGGAKPHNVVIFDLTNEKNPNYWVRDYGDVGDCGACSGVKAERRMVFVGGKRIQDSEDLVDIFCGRPNQTSTTII